MTQLIEESAGKIILRQEYSKPFRLFLAALSCFPLLAPYELLYKPRWNLGAMDWQGLPFLMFFLFLALAPLTITAGLLLAAILGPNESFTFDRYKQRLTYHASRRLWRRAVNLEIDYTDLPEIQIEVNPSSDGPDSYVLTLQLPGQRKMHIARYTGEQAAREMKAKLLAKA
jgi:hypothetical protein